jgi:hypothetical protein
MLNLVQIYFVMIFLFVFGQIGSAMMEGTSGIATTRLDGAITESEVTTVMVGNTAGFYSAATTGLNVIFIDGEQIAYSGLTGTTFTTLARGVGGTTPAAHSDNAIVYSSTPGHLNKLLGFQVAETDTIFGKFNVLIQLGGAIIGSLPAILTWDYAWMTGNGIWFRYFGWCLSAIVVLGLFIAVGASAAQSIFRR